MHLIVGLGKTGFSCARYLAEKRIPFAMTDSRDHPPFLEKLQADFPHVPMSLGKIDSHLCGLAKRIIISPGVSLRTPAIASANKKGVPIMGDIQLFAEAARAPIVAITGTNAKSTVTTLVAAMAKHAGHVVGVGGNLGTPATELLLSPEVYTLYVLELSSFQLETTHALHTKAATILNISEDHLDRYESFASYLSAKQKIYHNCDIAIVNRHQPGLWRNLTLPDVISFGSDAPQAPHFGLRKQSGQSYLAQGDQLLCETACLKGSGSHHMQNALAALSLGYAIGLSLAQMLKTLAHFEGLPHRCQRIYQSQGISWYNDSKATNVAAAQASITGLGCKSTGKLIVIAGGQGKQADFAPLYTPMQRYVRALILIGEDAPILARALQGSTLVLYAKDMQAAVGMAKARAKGGDCVMLAPACASFDMFRNFSHRGEVFTQLVIESYAHHAP